MIAGLTALVRNVRSKPIWFLCSLILLGVLIGLSRSPPSPLSAPSELLTRPPDLKELPTQLLASLLRMLTAYGFSLLFAVVIGTLAATNETRSRLILPILDVLQSIPILGFFPTAIAWFVSPENPRIGIEAAAIFLIFTSQSWNLAFGVYDGIKSIPPEAREAAKSLGLGPLALFRQLYVPAVFPRLIDNSILSWSNGWYFLMACEIIAMGPLQFRLPGLGSFLHDAIETRLWGDMIVGLLALGTLISAMDFLIWKPLGVLSAQYKFESTKQEGDLSESDSFLLSLYRNNRVFFFIRGFIKHTYRLWVRLEHFLETPSQRGFVPALGWTGVNRAFIVALWIVLIGGSSYAAFGLSQALFPPYAMSPMIVGQAVLASGLRLLVAYIFCLLWILPLVYRIHNSSRLSRRVRSLAQILSSIPATAFFPIITLVALKLFNWTEAAVMLLLLTGMQWYLLFNVLGGARAIPNDLREVARSLGVTGSLYWKRIFLPSIAPALVTGSITAVGGGWNALIIAEYFKIGDSTHSVFGIGEILSHATYETGNKRLLALSLFLMVSFILFLNRFMWQPLYRWAETKFRLEG